MANYLPVLLVSVSTNATPDDSALSTLPRGQVDYLSHDWQEEDVWKSWRNMTRQKNEIANGMRLENASWRTWWKQRNKLKTVSPETLNWLKDSDVTWLYGPLHTAVEWTPPPRKSTITPNDHLDLSSPKHKPILKHRNLSEFLTSDLPHSPAFSPSDSDSEQSANQQHCHSESQTDLSVGNQSRPPLGHTKSDTHITRWGPDRVFRKDSPPRVDPPAPSAEDRPSGSLRSSNHAYSGTDLNGYFQAHLRSNDNSPLSGSDANNSANTNNSSLQTQSQPKKKQKHITFNTYVEQCIAIDKPKSSRAEKVKKGSVSVPTGSRSGWDGRTGAKGVNWQMNYDDDDDDDVDDEGDEGG
ncbi:hypothetical protein F5146DRAFT_932904 [Armillaria mellea]|nr:hypothetical protein F5146DRAFT_932904 [Armillaria mellea]